MHRYLEHLFRLFSDTLFVAIGVTMIVETTIEGGQTELWVAYTLSVGVLYHVANKYHEGTEDMVEDIHDELHEEQ